MEWSISNLIAWFASLFLATLVLHLKKRNNRVGAKQRPPGPPAWPVLGNILDIGKIPHRNLSKLRLKYGPVIWLRLGYTNTLVIQSAKAAEELFKNHDITFCDRKVPECLTVHDYNQSSLSLGRYGSDWRFHRRLVTVELMTSKRINESTGIRRKCIDDMIRHIEQDVAAACAREESEEVVVAHYISVMAFNLIGNLVLSRDLLDSQSEQGTEFFMALEKVAELGGTPNLADFMPFLKGLDPQRIKRKMEKEMGRTLNLVDKVVRQRTRDKKIEKENASKDFLDTLLEYYDGPDNISIKTIVIIIMEIFFGGTETTSITIEWAMAELLRSPKSMRRVREELNRVVGPKRKVEESNIHELPYLQAVIKETMRLHPVFPLLLPRNSLQDTNFMGYHIPKDTQVFVNVWAIGRDPDTWEEPLCFKPERFLGSDIDFKGQNFEFIPFGSGRRICAGILLAHRVVHLGLASLIQSFDWKLNSKSTPETIDMKEKTGITLRKLIPLTAIPKNITRY